MIKALLLNIFKNFLYIYSKIWTAMFIKGVVDAHG